MFVVVVVVVGLFLLFLLLLPSLWNSARQTYLYHLVRKDNRHNFSIYFYNLYLSQTTSATAATTAAATAAAVTNSTTSVFQWSTLKTLQLSKLAFLPQLVTSTYVGIKYGQDLPFAMAIQTMIFVTFNKVCTAQYFLWYFCLIPLSLEQTSMSLLAHGVPMVLLWIGTYAHWLYWGYRLEFLGDSVFFNLWVAGVCFFLVNVGIVSACLKHHRYSPVFDKEGQFNKIQQDPGKNSKVQ